MKSVLLNGVEIKVGSMVRLINDEKMYIHGDISKTIIRPVLYGYYVVRGFSPSGAFFLEGIKNKEYNLTCHDLVTKVFEEPGFAAFRFIPVPPQAMTKSETVEEVKKSVVKIKIQKEVVESLDLISVSCN